MTKVLKWISLSLVATLGLIFGANLVYALTQKEASKIFPEEKTCVAYQTEKTFVFVRTITVTGKNCELSAQVIPEPDDKFHFEMNIPIAGFESGEAERDRDVAKLLKADISKELLFVTDSIELKTWKEKIASGDFELTGKLRIGKKKFPITIEASRINTGSLFLGVTKTTFKKFEIDPPSLLVGVGASVSEKLNLIFQLNTEDVLGAQTLLE